MSDRNRKVATQDEVDRAVDGIRRSIGRLVARLGDGDDAVLVQAVTALAAVGPFSVGPLATALPRASSPRHRAAILGVLLAFGPRAEVGVKRALTGAMMRDPDERIRAAAGAALTSLMTAGPGTVR